MNSPKLITALALLLFAELYTTAQSVGIGIATPHSSAALEVSSTTKGTLLTTMTTAQRKAIVNPATGLLVYDRDKTTIYMFDGQRWLPFLFSTTEKNPPTYLASPVAPAGGAIGYRVCIHGDYAVVGAYMANSLGGSHTGIALICFRNQGVWEVQDVLHADDAAPDDNFGSSVSINDQFAVIGATGDDVGADINQGSVYVFSRTGTNWTQQTRISAGDGLANDFFGRSVDISDDNILVIGADGDDISGNSNQGSAYVYRGTPGIGGFVWAQLAKLTASDGAAGDNFGNAVSIDGSYIAVGAYADDIGANADQGSAYSFYEFTNGAGWTTGQAFREKIVAGDGEGSDYFGISVDIAGVFMVIGASGADVGANADQGCAYSYFQPPTGLWTSGNKVTAPDGAANDNFGISVARSQGLIVVGAYRSGDQAGIINPGAVYVFTAPGTTFTLKRKVTDDDPDTNGFFGSSVSAFGFNIIMGAYGKNGNTGQTAFLNVQ